MVFPDSNPCCSTHPCQCRDIVVVKMVGSGRERDREERGREGIGESSEGEGGREGERERITRVYVTVRYCWQVPKVIAN